MLTLSLDLPARSPLRVLCIGAHCDDIEIGCGATLLVLQSRYPRLTVDWVVLSGTALRQRETTAARARFVKPRARGDLVFGNFADGRFPAQYGELKDFFEALKKRPVPDLILCHEAADRHQDHRTVNEMVWNTFRNHLVLEYEIMKWDGGLGQPNLYVPVTLRMARSKASTLPRVYRSQAGRDWFTPETFMALMRLRGIECRAPSGYAEAFHARKSILSGAPGRS
jgi:LmbE family N-acetylglucosaminyl deacetylase